jgi:hypothetical protein
LELKSLGERQRTNANAVLAEGVILQSDFLHTRRLDFLT